MIVAVTRPAIYTWPIHTIGMKGWLEPIVMAPVFRNCDARPLKYIETAKYLPYR